MNAATPGRTSEGRTIMNTHRTAAIAVGVLYIIGTLAGIASLVFTAGILDAPLATVAASAGKVQMGAVAVLVMGLALAMIPAVMFPILRKQSEALAVGYVIFRGALETFGYLAVALSWLVLAAVAQQLAGSAAAAAQAAGPGSLIGAAQAPITAVQETVFSLGALMFYYVLFRARLVPRWLSGWGILGAAAYFTTGAIAVFGPHLVPLLMPLALQEMVLAVWLIVKGFNSQAVAPGTGRPAPASWGVAEAR